MRMVKSKELSHLEIWENFRMVKGMLELPTGQHITPQQLLTGIALLSIQSDLELKTSSKLLRIARALTRVKDKRV